MGGQQLETHSFLGFDPDTAWFPEDLISGKRVLGTVHVGAGNTLFPHSGCKQGALTGIQTLAWVPSVPPHEA